MSDLLSIGVSGLTAYQQALRTTSHNISNVGNTAYSRQRVEVDTRYPNVQGNGVFGSGSYVSNVERAYSEMLTEQVRIHTSLGERADSYYTYASQVDNVLADPQVGLGPAMEEFFGAVQDVANDPASIPSRQVLLSAGESLVERFHFLDQRFADLQGRVSADIGASVDEINALGAALADVNEQIVTMQGASGGAPANDLLDKRDELLRQLSEKVQVQAHINADGSADVFIGSGQPLVMGNDAGTLRVTRDEFDPFARGIAINYGTGNVEITNQVSGGSLGGMLDFVSEVLDPARARLGQIATGLATSFNEQHALGVDLTDQLGGDFFSAPVPGVLASDRNTGGGPKPTTGIDDIAAITGDDYQLEYDGAVWTLTNTRDGSNVPLAPGSGTDADPWRVAGMTLSVQGTTPAAGDRYLVRSAHDGAADIGMQITDPERVAAAGALAVNGLTDANGLSLNSGSGKVSGLTVSRSAGVPVGNELLPLSGNIQLTHDGLGQYNLTLPPGYAAVPPSIAYDPATDEGVTRTITISDGTDSIDISFKLGGVPAGGDQFLIGNNSGASSDNANALALAGLEDASLLNNGSASFNGVYGQLVGQVGTRTHQADITAQAEKTLLNQAVESRENVVGVNLDEEAANLIKFQQAYQANARVISTANTIFQTLLSSVGG